MSIQFFSPKDLNFKIGDQVKTTDAYNMGNPGMFGTVVKCEDSHKCAFRIQWKDGKDNHYYEYDSVAIELYKRAKVIYSAKQKEWSMFIPKD